ncbi:hypothetical protein VUR80DRAFT_9070 [Thermomyces stellatus]
MKQKIPAAPIPKPSQHLLLTETDISATKTTVQAPALSSPIIQSRPLPLCSAGWGYFSFPLCYFAESSSSTNSHVTVVLLSTHPKSTACCLFKRHQLRLHFERASISKPTLRRARSAVLPLPLSNCRFRYTFTPAVAIFPPNLITSAAQGAACLDRYNLPGLARLPIARGLLDLPLRPRGGKPSLLNLTILSSRNHDRRRAP